MKVAAVIAAAGRGTRLGISGSKALVELAGQPMLIHSCRAMLDSGVVDSLVVTAPGDDIPVFEDVLSRAGIRAAVVCGGKTRQASVAAGLNAAEGADCVLIHDAARPLVPGQIVRRVVEALRDGHPAVVPALPVTDTIKEIYPGQASVAEGVERVARTIDRAALRGMQTPQGFSYKTIRQVHALFVERADAEESAASDDACLIEDAGIPVVLVQGSERAMKVTRPLDLRIAEMLAAEPGLG
ncbi:MAG: 2-C-methyl-D-erythritol 4-phosphate cytidylyltransferase [Actinomycetaceae bacterium]|nr:2-C-methyl-D-erythritol 4-phosphate cytidylyltransferase [Actinomycetaceae bacterium]